MSGLLPYEKPTSLLAKIGGGIVSFFAPAYYTANKQQETQRMVIQSNHALEASRQEMRVKEIEAQYLMGMQRDANADKRDELNRNFQKQLATINHQHQYKLEEFRAEVSAQLQRQNHDFQRWTIERQQSLQLELQKLNAELQHELRQLDRQAELHRIEEQKKINNSPIWLVASQILASNTGNKVPLRIFFSPPQAANARAVVSGKIFQLPESTEYITEAIRSVVEPMKTAGRNIDFLDGAWHQKTLKGAAAAASIFEMLRSEPTLIIESSLEGENLFVRFAYWGSGWESYRYRTILNISWRETLDELAKLRAQEWGQYLAKWKAAGKDVADFDKLYNPESVEVMIKNHDLLIREKTARTVGIPLEPDGFAYRWLKSDFNDLTSIVSLCHCVIVGLLADEYFLVDVLAEERRAPMLPSQLPSLLKNIPGFLASEMMQLAAVSYTTLYDHLEQRDHLWRPATQLDLANCLLPLPEKQYALAALMASVLAWLEQFGMPSRAEEGFSLLLSRMGAVVSPVDKIYVERLVSLATQLPEALLENTHAEWLFILEKIAHPATESAAEASIEPRNTSTEKSTSRASLGGLPSEEVLAWLPVMYRNFWGTVDAPTLAGLLGIPVVPPPSPVQEPGDAEIEHTRKALRSLRPQERNAFRDWRLSHLPSALQPRPEFSNLWGSAG